MILGDTFRDTLLSQRLSTPMAYLFKAIVIYSVESVTYPLSNWNQGPVA